MGYKAEAPPVPDDADHLDILVIAHAVPRPAEPVAPQKAPTPLWVLTVEPEPWDGTQSDDDAGPRPLTPDLDWL